MSTCATLCTQRANRITAVPGYHSPITILLLRGTHTTGQFQGWLCFWLTQGHTLNSLLDAIDYKAVLTAPRGWYLFRARILEGVVSEHTTRWASTIDRIIKRMRPVIVEADLSACMDETNSVLQFLAHLCAFYSNYKTWRDGSVFDREGVHPFVQAFGYRLDATLRSMFGSRFINPMSPNDFTRHWVTHGR